SDVALHAREVIDTGRPKLVSYGIADEDAWEVGLPCGGEIDVFLEPFEGELPDPETPQVVFTVVEGERAGERWVSGDGEVTRTQLVEREGERVFAEVLGPPPRLLVFGAVDLAEELCRAAKGLGWRTVVADARARFATAERIPSADELVVAWPEEVLQQFEPDDRTAVVVLTHEDRWDVPALAGALASHAFYIAALVSRRTPERGRAPARFERADSRVASAPARAARRTPGRGARPLRADDQPAVCAPAADDRFRPPLGAGRRGVPLRRRRHALSRPTRRLRDVQRRPQQSPGPAGPGQDARTADPREGPAGTRAGTG